MSTPSTDACAPGTLLKQGRYEIDALLGQGGFGSTWSARDHERGERVAIKRLEIWRAADWKTFELFEREVSVLQSISCAQVPAYIDYFEDAHGVFCLVQQLAAGHTIAHWVRERGWRPDDEELVTWLCAMLDVLEVLHAYRPPIIHRDIKPQNVLRDERGAISVVDFGSVKVHGSTLDEGRIGGSTMVGTFGYMAPEQLRGVATPATDLYGLAMTALFIMTHREPGELPTRRLKIDLEQVFGASWRERPLYVWLDGMIEPAEEDRFASAQQARHALLRGQTSPHAAPPDKPDDEPQNEDDEESDDDEEIEVLVRLPDDASEVASLSRADNLGCGALSVLGLVGVVVASIAWSANLWLWLVIMVAIPLLTIMMAVSLAPEKLVGHPRVHTLAARSDVAAFALATVVCAIVTVVFAYASAPLWATLPIAAMGGIALLMAAMYRSTWNALGRQQRIERQLHVTLPIIPKDQDRDMRIAVLDHERARVLEVREVNTLSARTLLVIAAVCLGIGAAMSVWRVPPPYDIMAAAQGVIALLSGCLGVWLGFNHVRSRALLRVDRVKQVVTGRTHGGARHTYHVDQVRGWEVCTQTRDSSVEVVVRLTVAHASEPGSTQEVEMFSVVERSEVLAAAQVVVWQRLLDEVFETTDVVLDFSEAEHQRQKSTHVSVTREVGGQAW